MVGTHTINDEDNSGEVIGIGEMAIHEDATAYVNDIMVYSLKKAATRAKPMKINRDPNLPSVDVVDVALPRVGILDVDVDATSASSES